MNLARLNHVLIPGTKGERDRLRARPLGRLVDPFAKTYYALSPIGRAVFLFALVAAFSGLDVQRSQNSMLWALLFSLLVATLVMRRLFALTGVRIKVVGPERIMAGQNAHFEVCLQNRSERSFHDIHVDGPFLPWDGSWGSARASLPVLGPRECRRLTLTARFEARGQHELDSFSASALVPLRLAQGPRLWSTGTRFIVVPRVAPIQPLELPPSERYQPGGVALVSAAGESMELVGVRPYRDGDRIRDLHAKTWARTGEPSVREYHQEYFSRVGVVLDTDTSNAAEKEFEAGVSLAAGIVSQLFWDEALIDLLIPGYELHSLTLGGSLGCFEQALDRLACVTPGPSFDAERTGDLLRAHLGSLSSVVLISASWDEERSALVRAFQKAGLSCRCIAVLKPNSDTTPLLPDWVRVLSAAEIREACETAKGIAL